MADVVVCDGFVGNTIIKQVEGVYSMALHDGLKNSYFNKLNYETVGGTPVLGINAPVLFECRSDQEHGAPDRKNHQGSAGFQTTRKI